MDHNLKKFVDETNRQETEMTTIAFQLSESSGKIVSTPESQTATQANTTILFQLVGQAANDYMITGYTSNDTLAQLGAPTISKNGVEMTLVDSNSKQEDINITVLTTHRTTSASFRTDPIVMNRPPR